MADIVAVSNWKWKMLTGYDRQAKNTTLLAEGKEGLSSGK